MSLLSISNIEFHYSNGKSNFSIQEINFDIERGDFLSIIGPNGSGKSTLIKLLTGFLKPKKGNVLLNEIKLDDHPIGEIARTIAYVPQLPNSIYPFSVYEIVAMGRYPYLGFSGIEKSNDHEKISEIIELLELNHILYKGINEISGGEAQRAFIARALVQEPEILLLDEPNAHLDIKHQISIFNLLKKLNKKNNLTVLTVMHDLNLTKYYSDRVLMLKEGKLVLIGNTDEIITKENIRLVFDVDVDLQKSELNSNYSIIINPDFTIYS